MVILLLLFYISVLKSFYPALIIYVDRYQTRRAEHENRRPVHPMFHDPHETPRFISRDCCFISHTKIGTYFSFRVISVGILMLLVASGKTSKLG